MINPNNLGHTAQHTSSPQADPNVFDIDNDGPLPMQADINEGEDGVVIPDTVVPFTA